MREGLPLLMVIELWHNTYGRSMMGAYSHKQTNTNCKARYIVHKLNSYDARRSSERYNMSRYAVNLDLGLRSRRLYA